MNVEKYLKILRDIRSGKSVSKDDLSYFANFTHAVDQTAIEKLKNTAEFKDLSEEEISSAMNDAFLLAVQNPQYKEQVLNIAEQTAKGKLSEKVATALNLALAGTDIGTSVAQITAANKAIKQAQRPSRPAPLSADPRLEQALNDAKRGSYDSIRALAPAQRAILDNYLSDLNMAQRVSGGQSGAYGALGQVASTRRSKAAQDLAPIADQFRRLDQQRYDQLLGQKLAENQAIQQSKAQYYPQDLWQYSQDVRAAGELGMTGRRNLRESLTGFASQLPNLVSELSTRRRFRDIYNRMSSYGDQNARLAAEADYEMYNGYNLPSYEQMYLGVN